MPISSQFCHIETFFLVKTKAKNKRRKGNRERRRKEKRVPLRDFRNSYRTRCDDDLFTFPTVPKKNKQTNKRQQTKGKIKQEAFSVFGRSESFTESRAVQLTVGQTVSTLEKKRAIFRTTIEKSCEIDISSLLSRLFDGRSLKVKTTRNP